MKRFGISVCNKFQQISSVVLKVEQYCIGVTGVIHIKLNSTYLENYLRSYPYIKY